MNAVLTQPNLKEWVDQAIMIDRRMKEDKKSLDELKAKLTTAAFSEMDNKNLKYQQIYGTNGSFSATYKEKLEIDDYVKIISLLGEVATCKIQRNQEVKYVVESRFKEALMALYNDNYSNELTVENVLQGLGVGENAIKMADKKLKGDYLKDKKVLESLGCTGELEEELDAIGRYRNWEVVEHFFAELSVEKRIQLKKTIFVEDQLAAALEYEK